MGRSRLVNAIRSLIQRQSELISILALLAAGLVAGLLTVRDYGESWDEPSLYRYTDYAISAYRFFFHPAKLPPFDPILSSYGPAYFMLTGLFVRGLQALLPGITTPVASHLCYFLTFLVGILLLYRLCRRWIGHIAGLAACLMFASQPLLWGHAFINPKDLPFMTFFLASVLLGFQMVDHNHSGQRSYWRVVLAGLMLGLTTSFRLVGPLAGVLAATYAVAKLRGKSLALLIVYGTVSLIASYISWPFLWGDPVTKFFASLEMAISFPYLTKVLFAGRYYAGSALPWFYFPAVLSIQLTLPLLLLVIAGLSLSVWSFFRFTERTRGPLWLFIGWFLVPLGAILVLHSTLYDNGRQLFFLLPPVFLLAGVALEACLPLLRKQWLQAGAVMLMLVPGLYGMFRLHPYEYTYYNQLVGGTGGAYSRFEMDYWGTSYREAALWLNQHAGPGSTLWATGPGFLLQADLRSDIKLSCASEISCGGHTDYVVAVARWKGEIRCAGARTVFSVGRRGAVFAVVKELRAGQVCK